MPIYKEEQSDMLC